MTDFKAQYGPWALVAGASMGIGRAYSHEAARRGLNVVMIARGEERLREIAAEVSAEHGVETRPVVADLVDPDDRDRRSAAATDDLEVGLFVYNATDRDARPLPRRRRSTTSWRACAVNCATPIVLCNLLGKPMAERGRGGIVMVSSNGGIAGSINFGTYGAGKAFEWILAETLWAELGEQRRRRRPRSWSGPPTSPNYPAFQATLDPALWPGTRLRATRSTAPAPAWSTRPRPRRSPSRSTTCSAPVRSCFSHPDDEFIFRATLALPRDEAVAVWRGVQETATRTPDRIAR